MTGFAIVSMPQLAAAIPADVDCLIVSASYEERAHSVYEAVFAPRGTPTYVCYNENHETYLRNSVDRLAKGSGAVRVPLDSDDPRKTFEALKGAVESVASHKARHVGIDVTGFTRESLAMLLLLCRTYVSSECKLTTYYHRARTYSVDVGRGWLSQGVRDVRSILGYAGRVKVSGSIHLILIAGFEIERAMAIVDTVGPSRITLGVLSSAGAQRDPTNPHVATLQRFIGRTEAMCMGMRLTKFEFSTSDAAFTRDAIRAIPRQENENTTIACLNSKPAMVGVCTAAIGLPDIQLVYAQPSAYNIANYSEPSHQVLVAPIRWTD